MSESTTETESVSVPDSVDDAASEITRDIEASGIDPAVAASVGSVALALYFYYVRGDKQRGQFVGLWPATILGIAAYFKLDAIERLLTGDD